MMERSELLRLMHEVLDGAASADETRELDRRLAEDPEARAQFDELERLFAGLNTMPKALPPEGLLDAVLAKLPRQHRRRDRLRQLSSRWRVLSVDSGRAQRSDPNRTSRTQRNSHNKSIGRSRDMSGPNIFSRKPTLWIGAGIAVVAVVVAVRYFDIPPPLETQGTIAPAKRFVADQPGAGDVNGGQSDASRSAVPDTTSASVDGAARDGASRDGASRDGAVRDGASRDGASRNGAARDGASRDGASKDGAAHDGASRDGASKDGAARDGASRDGASKDGAARDGASRDGASKDGAARDGASRDGASKDGAARDGASRDGASRDAARDSSSQQ
jgi:hypothetical protein